MGFDNWQETYNMILEHNKSLAAVAALKRQAKVKEEEQEAKPQLEERTIETQTYEEEPLIFNPYMIDPMHPSMPPHMMSMIPIEPVPHHTMMLDAQRGDQWDLLPPELEAYWSPSQFDWFQEPLSSGVSAASNARSSPEQRARSRDCKPLYSSQGQVDEQGYSTHCVGQIDRDYYYPRMDQDYCSLQRWADEETSEEQARMVEKQAMEARIRVLDECEESLEAIEKAKQKATDYRPRSQHQSRSRYASTDILRPTNIASFPQRTGLQRRGGSY